MIIKDLSAWISWRKYLDPYLRKSLQTEEEEVEDFFKCFTTYGDRNLTEMVSRYCSPDAICRFLFYNAFLEFAKKSSVIEIKDEALEKHLMEKRSILPDIRFRSRGEAKEFIWPWSEKS